MSALFLKSKLSSAVERLVDRAGQVVVEDNDDLSKGLFTVCG